jgi:septal ring factor EnvC (AmiA/AmiB activator)
LQLGVFKHFPAQFKIVVEELSAVTAEAVEAKQAKEELRATATKLDGKREAAETAAAKQAEEDVAARKEEEEEYPVIFVEGDSTAATAVPSPLHGLRPAPKVACPL